MGLPGVSGRDMLTKSLDPDSLEGYLPDVGMGVDPKEGSLPYEPKSYMTEGERGKEGGHGRRGNIGLGPPASSP